MNFDLKSLDPDLKELVEDAVHPMNQAAAKVEGLQNRIAALQVELAIAQAVHDKAARRMSLILRAGGVPADLTGKKRALIHEDSLLVDEDPPAPPPPPVVVVEPVVEPAPDVVG